MWTDYIPRYFKEMFHDHLPVLFNNPIIMREMIVRMRSKSSFIMLCVVAASAFLFVLPIMAGLRKPNQYVDLGEGYIGISLYLIFLFIAGITPLMSSVSIISEKEQNTWDLLCSTPISIFSLYCGKFLSTFLFVWLIFFSLMPFFSVINMIGGLSFGELLTIFYCFSELAGLMTALGIFCSCISKRSINAVMLALLTTLFYIILIPWFLLEHVSVDSASIMSPLYYIRWNIAPSVFFSNHRLINPDSITFWHLILNGTVFIILSSLSLFILYNRNRNLLSAKTDNVNHSIQYRVHDIGKLALQQKDYYTNFNRLWLIIKSIGLLLISTAILTLIFMPGPKDMNKGNIYLILLMFTPVMILPYAANCLRIEKDRDTFDLLLTSRLSAWDIVFSKFCNGLFIFLQSYIAFGIVLMVVSFIPAIHPSRTINIIAENIVVITLPILMAALFISIGILIATFKLKTISAYGLTFASYFFVIFLFPYIFSIFAFDFNLGIKHIIESLLFPLRLIPRILFNYPQVVDHYTSGWSSSIPQYFQYISPYFCGSSPNSVGRD